MNEEKLAGTCELTWDAASTAGGLPSGVYFYQIRVVNHSISSEQVFVQTKKMILMK